MTDIEIRLTYEKVKDLGKLVAFSDNFHCVEENYVLDGRVYTFLFEINSSTPFECIVEDD